MTVRKVPYCVFSTTHEKGFFGEHYTTCKPSLPFEILNAQAMEFLGLQLHASREIYIIFHSGMNLFQMFCSDYQINQMLL